jgi:hypothetical protein
MKTKIVEVQVPAILSVTVRVPEDATEEELYQVLTCIPAEEMEVKKWSDVDWSEVDIEDCPSYHAVFRPVLDYTEGFLLFRHEELHAEAQAKLHAEAQAKLPNEASDRVINTTLGSLKDLI